MRGEEDQDANWALAEQLGKHVDSGFDEWWRKSNYLFGEKAARAAFAFGARVGAYAANTVAMEIIDKHFEITPTCD